MKLSFEPVRTAEDRKRLAALADEIWHEYWPDLIGKEQTDYMVEQFQSLEAIERDMREHAYEYWLLRAQPEGRVVGYIGGCEEAETARFFVSKIYLLAAERGRGFASQAVRFLDKVAKARGLKALYLTVNKHNELAIRAYRGTGFKIVDAVQTAIGKGFVMDDFVMERPVSV